MGRTVVLERQALRRVVQVRSSDEMAFVAVQRHLDLWSGQSGKDEEQAKTRFHWALDERFGEVHRAA